MIAFATSDCGSCELPPAVRRITELGDATVVLKGKSEIRETRLLAFAFKSATYEAIDRALARDPHAPVIMMHMADGWSGPLVCETPLTLRAFWLVACFRCCSLRECDGTAPDRLGPATQC